MPHRTPWGLRLGLLPGGEAAWLQAPLIHQVLQIQTLHDAKGEDPTRIPWVDMQRLRSVGLNGFSITLIKASAERAGSLLQAAHSSHLTIDPLNVPKASVKIRPCHLLLEPTESGVPSAVPATDHQQDKCCRAADPTTLPTGQQARE